MKEDNHIDYHLVKGYIEGDKMAMTKLVKRWHLKFCEKAFWVVKDRDLSKDIAQESWKTIMNNIHNLKDKRRFKSWALRIVYHNSIDALRTKHKFQSSLNHTIQKCNINDNEDDNKTAQKQQLLKAIHDLPEHQQLVLRLFYTEDYSLKEISELIQISVGTVKSRLFHARESLKRTLKSNTL